MLFPLFLVFCLVSFYGALQTIRKGQGRHLWPAVGAFVLTLGIGTWSILQSRSSTAGIGFLFLPFFAVIPASGGWLWSRYRKTVMPLAVLGLLLVVGFGVWMIRAGIRTRDLNAARDAAQKENDRQLAQYRQNLREIISSHQGQEEKFVSSFLSAHSEDRAALLAALETPYVPPEWLEKLSNSTDMGLALQTIRNPRSTPSMLEKIHRNATYKDYYAVDLARNPRTPKGVLSEIAKGKNLLLADALLVHPNLDCAILRSLKSSVETGYEPDEQKSAHLAEINERLPKLCTQ